MSKMSKPSKTIATLLFAVYLVVGIVTLPKYGINWDTINHLPRGQAYLHYYLTKNTDFSDLPKFEKYWQDESTLFYRPDKEGIPRRSLYQNDSVDYNYFIKNDGYGHPPTSDILSSFFNYVLFQKLGIINDIDSYRVYGIVVASLLISLIYWWTAKKINKFSGVIAALSLATYPLFWSESHFNTEKDIPETVFWSFFLYALWKGINYKKALWILASGVFFGLALGTKLNILFVGFIVIPWLIFLIINNNWPPYPAKLKRQFFKNFSLSVSSVSALFIGFTIFYVLWPYLWYDPLGSILSVVNFYGDIGTATSTNNFETYAIKWIFYTTPPIIIFLSSIGIFTSAKEIIKERDEFYLLILLWLVIPIARVSMPGSNIYGGVRQIMEFIPAMAILAGVGAYTITKNFNHKKIVTYLIIISFGLHIFKLATIHPNENAYFNVLIGGLSGAKEEKIPYWGNTFGAAYRQGVEWINNNAEENAKVVYASELIPNIPSIWFRSDIMLHNKNRSGYLKRGEYAITLTYQGTAERSYYDSYLELLMKPVYESTVDGVSVVKVWHNTVENQKYDLDELSKPLKWEIEENGIFFDAGEVMPLSRIEFHYSEKNCADLKYTYISIAEDDKKWIRLPGMLPGDWLIPHVDFGPQPLDGLLKHPFVGQKARYVYFTVEPKNACIKNVEEATLFYFNDIPEELNQELSDLF